MSIINFLSMIELLPSHIANQIAAGEVVQRGASIVKELIENAVDAGATRVVVRIEDGGRTMIHVADDGCGMSADDAPRAFLRHATSKIRTADDLFALRTFGFRGEALASIASVAEVELTTRRQADEVATTITVRDAQQINSEARSAAVGTSITVRNLFYSIPARRKFLKTDAYEAKLCRAEFIRVALVNEGVAFEYFDNLSGAPIILPAQNRHSRIVALTRQSYAKKLLAVEASSPLLTLSGYVGTPDTARVKGRGEQYLFVNGRFFRNPRIYKAICDAYGRLIPSGMSPTYFLYLNVGADRIDVNINPTKTEVKFDDEDAIWQIVSSAVKHTLGRNNVVESIDFTPSEIDIPTFRPRNEFVAQPSVRPDRPYNPFENSGFDDEVIEGFDAQKAIFEEPFSLGDSLFDDQTPSVEPVQSSFIDDLDVVAQYTGVQFGANRYIATNTVDGLAIVNIARAMQRIEYERIVSSYGSTAIHSSQLAVPHKVELTAQQKVDVLGDTSAYEALGFSIANDQGTTVALTALPEGFTANDFLALVEESSELDIASRAALIATRSIANRGAEKLSVEAISSLLMRLMQCEEPSYTPTGLPIIDVIENADIDKRFKR